ncbi:hypothetical protein BST28156_06508 [Burkholderia stagnalis]|nr:hypothetical protein BST28156_06508 [Burkholderia stagnalis]
MAAAEPAGSVCSSRTLPGATPSTSQVSPISTIVARSFVPTATLDTTFSGPPRPAGWKPKRRASHAQPNTRPITSASPTSVCSTAPTPSDGAAEPTTTLDAIWPAWFTAFMSAAAAVPACSATAAAQAANAIARRPDGAQVIDSASGCARTA